MAVEKEVETVLRASVAVTAPAVVSHVKGREKAERWVTKAKGGTKEFALDVEEVVETRDRQSLVVKAGSRIPPGKGVKDGRVVVAIGG